VHKKTSSQTECVCVFVECLSIIQTVQYARKLGSKIVQQCFRRNYVSCQNRTCHSCLTLRLYVWNLLLFSDKVTKSTVDELFPVLN